MNTIKLENKTARMVAHRGVSKLERENTCAAFIAAGNRSYFGIETDVHRTADGKYIIIHDDTTTRVTGKEMVVEETDFDTLRQLRVFDIVDNMPRADLCLPTLEEYISICKKYEKVAVLELKNPMEPDVVKGIVETVAACGHLEKTLFISFALQNLVTIREMLPQQPAQYLVFDIPDPQGLLATLKQYNLDLDAKYIAMTKEIVDLMHANGIEVNVWTVDTVEDAERMMAMGVDYITTNILE